MTIDKMNSLLATKLLDQGIIEPHTLSRAKQHAQNQNTSIWRVLSLQGHVSDDILATHLAHAMDAPLLGITTITQGDAAIEGLNLSYLKDRRVLPLVLDSQQHMLITAVDDLAAVKMIEQSLGTTTRLAVCTPDVMDQAFQHFFSAEDDSLNSLSDGGLSHDDVPIEDDSAPVVRFVNALIERALKARASDIHLEPFESRLVIRFRKDGVLTPTEEPPAAVAPELSSRIKLMAGMDIAERRLPQDGRIRKVVRGHVVELRASTLPGLYGESIVLRVLNTNHVKASLPSLGFDEADIRLLQSLVSRPSGITLVCGPTGSGKTTTLYACLDFINNGTRKILTAEDPVEYQMDGIIQTHVKPKLGLDFARVLRAALRQDPDIIMVGEIRDVETAEVAVQASLTGHMVLSTLHTNSAIATITRLMDMGVEPYLMASSLNGIVAQRLVRCLCPHCKQPITPTDQHRAWYKGHRLPEKLYEPAGCEQCHRTGYHGRTVLYEILECSDTLTALISNGAHEDSLLRHAKESRFTPMRDVGKRLASEGLTSMEEVLRVTMERPA